MKDHTVVGQNQPYRRGRRDMLAFNMIGTANLLKAVCDQNLRILDVPYDYNNLTQREYLALRMARTKIRWAIKAMRLVAKSLDSNPEGTRHLP